MLLCCCQASALIAFELAFELAKMSSILSYFYNSSKDVLGSLYQMVPQASKSPSPVVPTVPKMDVTLLTAKIGSSPWIKVAAISGAIAVMLGAYGAHGQWPFVGNRCT